MPGPRAPRALLMDPGDNVAVAVADVEAGEDVAVSELTVTLRESIGVGHKLAVRPIGAGSPVRKYGETIGIASVPIDVGEHVHVHNVVSARLPAPDA